MKFRKFFGYAGGQANLLPTLIELVPHHFTYVELFAGGLTLFFNKQPSKVEVINDLNRKLVNLFLVLKDNPDEFRRQLSLLPNSRELFAKFKREVNTETDDVKRAVMYYYMIQNTWSGRTAAPTYVSKSRNLAKIDEIDWFAQRMRHVTIENLDFEEVILKYDSSGVFFFCDPPYMEISGLYEFSFNLDDHVRFANALKKSAGLWLVTYNNHPLVDLLFKNYYKIVVDTARTMSKVEPGGKRTREEHLLVANYDIVTKRFKPFQAKYFKL